MAKINYQKVGWNTTSYFGPTNMNHMDDGIKAACDGVDAANENLGNLDNELALSSNIVTSSAPTKTDLLDVDFSSTFGSKNRVHRIVTSDASKLLNSPVTTGTFFAKWELIPMTIGVAEGARMMVKITEFFPKAGRVWFNHYNYTKWDGWYNDYDKIAALNSDLANYTKKLFKGWSNSATVSCYLQSEGLALLFLNNGSMYIICTVGNTISSSAIQQNGDLTIATNGLSLTITDPSENKLFALLPINGTWTLT